MEGKNDKNVTEGFISEIEVEEEYVEHPVNVTLDVGMKFSDLDIVYGIYNTYVFSKRFGIKKINIRKNYALFVCHKSRFYAHDKESNESEGIRRLSFYQDIGCKAAIHVYKEQSSTMWKITNFLDEHNHKPCSPNIVALLRSHKHIPASAKSLTGAFNLVGVQIGKVHNIFGLSRARFESRDCYNHMVKIRRIMYEAGDAQPIQSYCSNCQMDDPGFFYSIQLDDDSRMINFFWIESRSRRAYELFGDAVTFDTTYRTNKYSIPFAPFVGMNNHLQTILFGCALLHDETKWSRISYEEHCDMWSLQSKRTQ